MKTPENEEEDEEAAEAATPGTTTTTTTTAAPAQSPLQPECKKDRVYFEKTGIGIHIVAV